MGKHKIEKHRKSHRKEGKRRREPESPSSPPPPGAELLVAAALGDRSRCKSLLRRGADVNWAEADLSTPLHATCRHGHVEVAKLLLRKGAASTAQDLRGDTPAHLAARHRHLPALAALLQSDHPPSVDEPNDKGETVRQLTAAAMAEQEAQERLACKRRAAEVASDVEAHGGGGGAGDSGVRGGGWVERLQEELSEDEAWGAYGSSGWHADEYETPEEYAKRIWQEMRARREAEAAAQAATVRQARREQETRRERARRQAEEASREVLDREQAVDADWRAAVAAGAAGAKRASYEARWEFFCTKHGAKPVALSDVPWILQDPEAAVALEELRKVVLYGASTADDRRRRLRSELIRWHPDKWEAKWGRALVAGERARVLERVKEYGQALNAVYAQVQAEATAVARTG